VGSPTDNTLIVIFLEKQEFFMNIVTVSTKYQVVIPQKIREEFHIIPGKKFKIFRAEALLF